MSPSGMYTRAVHAGESGEWPDVSPPIHTASTFRFESAAQAARAFEREDRPIYTRWGNPTTRVLERKIAELEGGDSAVATASGMAAVSAALLSLLEAGDHLVASSGLYSGTHAFVTEELTDFEVETTLVDPTDPEGFEDAIRPRTRAVYLESPGNPTLVLNDLEHIAGVASSRGITTVIDNTFATPWNQNPISMGVDVVIHSATKFLCGHGDALGGVVVGPESIIRGIRTGPLRHMGGVIGPFNAWLIARGIQTFPLRMRRHNENALEVARWLHDQANVSWVRYPHHPSHPQHSLAREQMTGGGGVVVFELGGGVEAGRRLMDHLELITRAVSLGDTRSLITHPASTTHHSVHPEDRQSAGITDGLVRLSVGIEDPVDLIEDLDRALGEAAV